MLRNFVTRKTKNRFITTAFAVAISLFFVTQPTVVHAEPFTGLFNDASTLGGIAIGFINSLLFAILWFIVLFLTQAVGLLIAVGQFPFSVDSSLVNTGWIVLRDISNMFFVIILLLIAFGTILRISQFQLQSLLPKVVLMAILVNFSKVIVGFFIEVSQIVMLTFVAAYKSAGAGNILSAFQIDDITKIISAGTSPVDQGNVFASILGAIIYSIVALVVVIAFLGVFIVRIVSLWLLAVFSPLAFTLSVIPGGQRYASLWWDNFGKYVIIGPVLAFFLWLSLATLPTIVQIDQSNLGGNVTANESLSNALELDKVPSGLTVSTEPISFLHFMLSTAMLVMSLYFAQSIGGAVGAVAGRATKTLQYLGKNAAGLRPLARYLDERRGLKGKASLNPFTYIDAWQRQREATKKERTADQIGLAEAIAKQGVIKSATSYVSRRRQEPGIQDTITELDKAIDRLRARRSRGQGFDLTAKQRQYRLEFEDARRKFEDADADRRDFTEYRNMRERLEVEGEFTGDDKKKYEQFKARFGKFEDVEEMNEQLDTLNRAIEYIDADDESKSGLRAKYAKAKENKELAEEGNESRLAQKLKDDAQIDLESSRMEISLLEGNNMGLSEVVDELEKTNTEIAKFEELIRRLNAMGGSDEDKRNAQTELDSLNEIRDMYREYQTKLEKGELDLSAENFGLTKHNYTEDQLNRLETRLDKVKVKEAVQAVEHRRDLAKERVEAEPMTNEEIDRTIQEENRLLEAKRAEQVKLSKMVLPTYYQEKQRRLMVGEKLKELQGIEDSDELISIYEKAESLGDEYMVQAVLNKLAGDGNHNDILNHYGYHSGYKGMHQFYTSRVAKALGKGDDAKGQEKAMRLARDISYIAENINHRDISRMIGMDLNTGKLRWLSEDEHADAAMAEINKLNPQQIKRNFNRLAVMGEEKLPNGDFMPIWGKLAQKYTVDQYDNIWGGAKFGGDLQKNQARNLWLAINAMPAAQRMEDGFEELGRRLDTYLHEKKQTEGNK